MVGQIYQRRQQKKRKENGPRLTPSQFRAVRGYLGLSQEQAAKMCGVSRQWLNAFETGSGNTVKDEHLLAMTGVNLLPNGTLCLAPYGPGYVKTNELCRALTLEDK